jgi:hypothetical protein
MLHHGRWLAYAARALITRFVDLASKADSLDILLVLAGYILMHTTFFRLLLAARALGSNFWLTAGILTSATLAFVLAMPVALHLGIPVDPVLLTEALPFLVCTVGFEKPLRLARAVFTHEHIYTPVDGRSRGGSRSLKPAGQVILEAYDRVGNTILRDYALEIFVLTVGASSKVGGLRECCALAAVILAMDCVVLTSMYTAVLTVMVEVSLTLIAFIPLLFSSVIGVLVPFLFHFWVLSNCSLRSFAFVRILHSSSSTHTVAFVHFPAHDFILVLHSFIPSLFTIASISPNPEHCGTSSTNTGMSSLLSQFNSKTYARDSPFFPFPPRAPTQHGSPMSVPPAICVLCSVALLRRRHRFWTWLIRMRKERDAIGGCYVMVSFLGCDWYDCTLHTAILCRSSVSLMF